MFGIPEQGEKERTMMGQWQAISKRGGCDQEVFVGFDYAYNAKVGKQDFGEAIYRQGVPGGWLVSVETYCYTKERDPENYDSEQSISLAFCPDPEHAWKIQTEPVDCPSPPSPDVRCIAEVPDGWLVMAISKTGLHPGVSALAFYPDPEHQWTP